jgi:hypothetical protein
MFTRSVHPTEGVLMRRMRTGRMRRLRVRPTQPNLRGPRETLLGPTTWVRPATGWWERMNAGESLRNQGRSVKAAPVRFQKAVPGTKEKRRGEAPKGEPVRVMGRPFPSAEGTGPTARRPTGAAFRTSACRRFAPSDWGTSLDGGPGACSPGTMERGSMKHDEHQTSSSTLLSTEQLATDPSCPRRAIAPQSGTGTFRFPC